MEKGRRLSAQHIGALAAMGLVTVPVVKKLKVAVLSTGDELVPPETKPGAGQVRDVNLPMLCAMLRAFGAEAVSYGIIKDEDRLLKEAVEKALSDCDAVIISGGSSVGEKDAACRVIESLGEVLLHGIAIKPGKPTIIGRAGQKPLIGLPGHPVAAWFVTRLFVQPLLGRLEGRKISAYTVPARLYESVGANHGRAQYNCASLFQRGGELWAKPIRSKSGLISSLAEADGYFCIERDCEGLPKGAEIQVTVCGE